MKPNLPNSQKQLLLGTETISETPYKGYIIRIRAYNGISGKIIKVSPEGKNIVVRERLYDFFEIDALFTQLKDYIDMYEGRLIQNYINKINRRQSK